MFHPIRVDRASDFRPLRIHPKRCDCSDAGFVEKLLHVVLIVTGQGKVCSRPRGPDPIFCVFLKGVDRLMLVVLCNEKNWVLSLVVFKSLCVELIP